MLKFSANLGWKRQEAIELQAARGSFLGGTGDLPTTAIIPAVGLLGGILQRYIDNSIGI